MVTDGSRLASGLRDGCTEYSHKHRQTHTHIPTNSNVSWEILCSSFANVFYTDRRLKALHSLVFQYFHYFFVSKGNHLTVCLFVCVCVCKNFTSISSSKDSMSSHTLTETELHNPPHTFTDKTATTTPPHFSCFIGG